jgi:D-alanyl-D-alanine carboxypeptidase
LATVEPPAVVVEELEQLQQMYPNRAVVAYGQHGDESSWHVTLGSRDGDSGDDVELEDRAAIGSATKMFTAASVMLLVESGELSLDEYVSEHVPVATLDDLVDGEGSKIQVKHLLSHRTGMGDHINFADDATVLQVFGSDGAGEWTPDELVEMTRDFTLYPENHPELQAAFPHFTLAGEGVESFDDVPENAYSNTGYVLAGMVVESASGMSWEDYVQTNILDVLDMERTGFSTRDTASDWSGRYTGVAEGTVTMPPSLAWSAGAVVSTAPDMAKFVRGAIGGELFDDPATVDAWRSAPALPLGGSIPYALGLMEVAPGCFGHTGQTFGGQFMACYDPDADSAYALGFGDAAAFDVFGLAQTMASAGEGGG